MFGMAYFSAIALMAVMTQGARDSEKANDLEQEITTRSLAEAGDQVRRPPVIANFAIAPDNISRLSDAAGARPRERPQPGRRQLQDSCAAGDPIEVISFAFPLLEGCHFELDSDGATTLVYLSVQSDSAVGVIQGAESDVWVSWYYPDGTPDTTPTTACFSEDDPAVVTDPTQVTWLCDLDGTGIDYVEVSASEFSVICGCSSTTVTEEGDVIPISAPAPTPPLGATCSEGDAFTVTAPVFPEVDGCYRDSGLLIEGEPVYSETGTAFFGQNMVFASADEDTGDVVWLLAFQPQTTTSGQFEPYCISANLAAEVHPSEAEAWGCVIDSTTTTVTEDTFSVECGCEEGGVVTTDTTATTTSTTSIVISTCTNGIEGVQSTDGNVCCVSGCGLCGGSGCASAGGLSAEECCEGTIANSGVVCDDVGVAPCIINVLEVTTPAPVPETPAPVVPETPAPVVPETPAPVAPETPAPVVPETPAPVVPETPAPVAPETPAPVVPETPAPVVPETPAPVVPETPAPVVPETPAPVVPETPAPVPETPAPVVPETPAPVPETPAPVVPETPAPVPETPAPVVPETPAPVPETPAPVVPETPAPVPETPAPVVPETPAPVPETPAPVPETPAPVLETAAPVVPETAAPVVPVTAAPVVPETPAPVVPEVPTQAPVVSDVVSEMPTPEPTSLAIAPTVDPETPAPTAITILIVEPDTPAPSSTETPTPAPVPETPAPTVAPSVFVVTDDTPSPSAAMAAVTETETPAPTDTDRGVVTLMPTPGRTGEGTTFCINGVIGIESEDGEVCCDADCGECGGVGCGSAGGLTAEECCSEEIVSSGEFCEETGMAPCIIISDDADFASISPTVSPNSFDLALDSAVPTSSPISAEIITLAALAAPTPSPHISEILTLTPLGPEPEPSLPLPTLTSDGGDRGIDGPSSPAPTGFQTIHEPTGTSSQPLLLSPGLNITDTPTASPSSAPTDLGSGDMPSLDDTDDSEDGDGISGGKRSADLASFAATTACAVTLAAGVHRMVKL